jgi:mono/diheme cytochrome c family protein
MQKLVFLAFIAVFLLAACSPADLDFQYSDLPQGDAGRGKDLFAKSINGTVACSNCHTLSGGDTAGPTLQDYGPTAASRVEGQTAEEYTFYSTLQPSKYLVAGFSNVMPSNYDEKLSKQEIADLIAYMLTLGIDEEGIAAQPSQGGNNTVDISMIVFRVIHIFAAVFMAGFALFMLVFVEPAITAMGTDTQGFMRGFYKSAKRYETVLTILAMLTLLSGIVLFYRVSDHFNADWLASTPGVVLLIS